MRTQVYGSWHETMLISRLFLENPSVKSMENG